MKDGVRLRRVWLDVVKVFTTPRTSGEQLPDHAKVNVLFPAGAGCPKDRDAWLCDGFEVKE
jgi:hypothetical protein